MRKKFRNTKKNDLFLLCNGNEVLWVAGIGISEKIKVVNKPTHMITLKQKGFGYGYQQIKNIIY